MTDKRPILFCLHALGGSERAWAPLAWRLQAAVRCVALDLPGFGAAAAAPGATVDAMAAFVAGQVKAAGTDRWLLAGHSMGAKVALAVARRAEDSGAELDGLAGLVLLAGSPAAPEPMAEGRRATMLGWFQDGSGTSQAQARAFIEANTAAPLEPALDGMAVEDLLRTNPAAWRAWLQFGSREDWRQRIGTLRSPALILAGAADQDLGADAQRRLMMPHFAGATLHTIAGAKHLLPLERPTEVALAIAEWIGSAPSMT